MASLDDFESQRPLLLAIAYRMLGSVAEAEDTVQDAYLRWRAAAAKDEVQSAKAYLVTVVTRLCLDHLKSAAVQRESYVGTWLPEPMRTGEGVDSESISMAFLVLLETLSPAERAVYLWREVFDYTHGEIAAVLSKDEPACRQIYHRARAHIVAKRPRFSPTREAHRLLLVQFMQACTRGDLEGLERLLASDVTVWADGGGKASAALKPVHGREHAARLLIGLAHKLPEAITVEILDINGAPSLVVKEGEQVSFVLILETDGQSIVGVFTVRNPDKLLLSSTLTA